MSDFVVYITNEDNWESLAVDLLSFSRATMGL